MQNFFRCVSIYSAEGECHCASIYTAVCEPTPFIPACGLCQPRMFSYEKYHFIPLIAFFFLLCFWNKTATLCFVFFVSPTFPVISTLLTPRSPARCFVTRVQQIMRFLGGRKQLCTTAELTPSCWLALEHDSHTLSGKWRLCCE